MTLRFGVLGYGSMGRLHANALGRLDGVELVAIADPHTTPIDGLRVVRSGAELIAAGLDACVIATPTPDHAGAAIALADAGVHLLIEKPLAMTPADCRATTEACARAGIRTAVGHVERFHPRMRELRAQVRTQAVGTVTAVVARRTSGPPRRDDHGGVLLDLASHDLDLAEWLTGLRVAELSATGTDEDAEILGVFESGATLRAAVAYDGTARHRSIAVTGTTTTLSAETSALPPAGPDPVTAQLTAFCDLLRGADGDGLATLAEGARAVDLVWQARGSRES